MAGTQFFFRQLLFTARYLLRWTVLTIPLALVTGSLVALFLWLLDKATHLRWAHSRLLLLLPLAGLAIHFLYRFWGRNAERGNNLIIDEIHAPGGGVPARMAPLVVVSTLITHLFGGSAGREGTAVQVGGSIAALLGKWLKLSGAELRVLLMAGIAAGFGAVFGTPVAGAVFALEVPATGRMEYRAWLPCLLASLFGNVVTLAWGIHHTQYQIRFRGSPGAWLHFDFRLLASVIIAGIAFGLAARFFTALTHGLRRLSAHWIKPQWLIPVIGGALIIGLTYALGSTDYLGLGVTAPGPGGVSIVQAFETGGVGPFSWLWKLVFTAVTLGMGFKGGEVTPLFFIGAALGNVLAGLLGVPAGLLAGLGFIAVFAGAANTPLACILMGIELFGAEYVLYYAVACFTANYFSGHSGIYSAQRTKGGQTRE